MPDGTFNAGDHTIQWGVDQRNIGQIDKLSTARTVAQALRGIGTLRGDAPRALDCEVINNPIDFDTVMGVVRIRFPNEVSYSDFGAVVVETLRGSGFPDAIPHVQWSAAGIAGEIGNTAASVWGAIGSLVGIGGEAADAEIDYSGAVVLDTPGINNTVRPALAANMVGAIAATGSTRQSEDGARNGSVAVSEAASAARSAATTAGAALGIPWWVYATAAVGGLVLVGAISYAIASKAKG